MDDFTEIRQTATQGFGVFAKKDIPSYTTIIKEQPIITIKATPDDPARTDAAVEYAFQKLSKNNQTIVLQLHEGSHPTAKTKVTRIFHANSFGDEEEEKLYLAKSRINHSCVPNAISLDNEGIIRTIRAIEPGEEITICYLAPFQEAMTTRQRATLFQLHYNFTCRCVACWPAEQSWVSDLRRQLIGFLSHALQGENAPDHSPLDTCDATSFGRWDIRPTRHTRVLTPTQEIEYSFLLANLREAEGLPAVLIAGNLFKAATKLVAQQTKYERHPLTNDIIFLEAARCINAWFKKGLNVQEKYYSSGHEDIRDATELWETTISKLLCLQYLRMTDLMKTRGEYKSSKSGEDFAMLVEEENFTMTSLSKNETANLIRKRINT